jgi:thiamine biosynthesis lipoprotein
MSDYKETSELMRLCQQSGGPPVKVSAELFFVLNKSQAMAKASDGAFDITVGPLVKLWRRARRQEALPDEKRLKAALELVGYQHLKLDEASQTAHLMKKGMQLDLGGIGKGYAADEAVAVLKKHGIGSCLVAAGGDLVAGDPPPGEVGWKIGIAPLQRGDPVPKIYLKNAAASTAGDAEQSVVIGGKRYSHIVNPKTGLGVTGRSSATVVAPSGILADSLDTAMSVLGPRRGIALIETYSHTAAIMKTTDTDDDGTFASSHWKDVPKASK